MLGSMGANALSGGGGGNHNWTFNWLIFALMVIILTPLCMSLLLPAEYNSEYADVQADIEEQYLHMTGYHSTPQQNIWTLTGIYTPYNSEQYGWTEDGWLYGTQVKQYSPKQYESTIQYVGSLEVKQANNGIWYYNSVPQNFSGITLAQWDSTDANKITNPDKATVYTNVYFDEDYCSDVFFTSSTKTVTSEGYFYEYSGYRYVFQPLSDYNVDVSGNITKVTANNTSLSLIWYKYSTLSGISGQLTISGNDSGLSYLTSDDIIREFNSTNYSSTFDMTFNGVQMHLIIRLDPARLATMSVADCYNTGYWSVMVYSDAVADSLTSATYSFNVNTIMDTLMKIFMFDLADEYGIDGWMAFLVSLMYSVVFYSVFIVIALDHPMMFIIVGLMALIQAATSFLGSGFNLFG